MKKTFTVLIAAIAAILMMALPVTVWADNVTVLSENFNNGTAPGWALSGTTSFQGSNGAKSLQIASGSGAGSATTPAFSSLVGSTATLTFKAKSSGSATRTLTITGTNCKVDGKASTTISATSTQQEFTIAITNAGTTSTVTFSAAKNAGTLIDDVLVYYVSGPTQLAAPTNFSATAGNAQATFSWTAVEHASSYTILAKNGDTWDNPTTLFDNVSLTNGQYVGTGLSNGTTYVCKVRANGDGTNYSNSVLSEATATFTPTAAQQYTVTIADGITGGTVGANPTTATSGTEISLTKEPAAGYGFTSWNVYKTGDQNTTVTVTSDKFSMPAYDVTVSATFTPYTVTLNANGSTSTWNVTMNGGNLPDAATPCASWSFYGWSTAAANTQTTTAPTTMVNGTGYTPTGNITLYAVYKKTEGGGSFDGTNGGDFLIYANTGGETPYHYATGTISNNALSSTTNTSDAAEFSFTKTNNNTFTIKIKGSSNYVSGASGGNMSLSTTACEWTPSEGINGTWRLTSPTDTRGFIYRSTGVFKNYATSNVTANGTEYYDLEIGTPSTTYYHSTPDCTQTVETPTFDPDGGNFETTQTVHISCETSDVSIFYTLNDDEPTDEASETNFAYNAQQGVSIATTTTLKAKAFKEGWYASATKSATYTIQHDVAEPTLPESQVFTTPTYSVEITVPANTTVYYTTNGDNPTNASTLYSTAFTIDATKTVKAIAYDADGCASDVVTATFTRAYTLAAAKALYVDQNVPNITISLTGVQFIAKSGSSTYMQQGTTGLMIYGSHSQDLTNGDVFTAGTVTGTITKYGENLELSISSGAFANVAKTAGTLTASATGVTISNITGSFSTYEDRFVSLTSLTMSVSGKTLTDTDSHTLAIYDPFNVLNEAIQPDHNVIVNGVITSNTKNSTTTYQIIPLAKSGISTGVAATLPTLDPVGGETDGEALETETVTITPATGTTVTYAFGEDYDEIDSETELTVPSTNATALELVVNRDFYTENTATYYYKTSATTYDVSFYVNGDEDTSLAKEVLEGGAIGVLPTPTAPSGYTFRGWAQAEISGVQNNAPTVVTSATTVDDDMDLYAVFCIAENSMNEVTKSYGFESESDDWTIAGPVQSIDYANSGSYSGKINTNNTYVTFKEKVKVTEFSFAFTRASGNNNYNVYIETKDDSDWEAVETYAMSSFDSDGTFQTKTKTFDGTTELYVRFHCYNTTAIRYVDDVTITYLVETTNYSNYCTTVSPAPITVNGNGELTADYTISTGAAYTLETPVTVPSGKTLTVPADAVFANANPANLIVKDGGRLIVYNEGVQATVMKEVEGAGNDNWNATTGAAGWYFIASPVDGASFSTATGVSEDYDLYMLDWNTNAENSHWLNQKNDDHVALFANGFQRGTGYLYASKDGNTVSVAGEIKPLTAADTAQVVLKTNGWNLIGNPLTCKVTVDKAFSELTNASTVTNSASGSTINPCQGIAVYGNAGTPVTFTKAESQNAAAPSNSASLQMTLGQNIVSRGSTTSATVDNAVVSFNEGSVLPKFSMLEGDAKLYIPQGNQELAIVSAEAQGELPVNFVTRKDGQYTITINAEAVEMNYLHLIDNIAGQDIDLLANPSYTFTANADDYPSRFRLVFIANDVNQNDNENESFAFIGSDGQLIVNGIGTVQIIDLTGRVISTKSTEERISTNGLTPGVYVLRLIGEKVKTQKIVVR